MGHEGQEMYGIPDHVRQEFIANAEKVEWLDVPDAVLLLREAIVHQDPRFKIDSESGISAETLHRIVHDWSTSPEAVQLRLAELTPHPYPKNPPPPPQDGHCR